VRVALIVLSVGHLLGHVLYAQVESSLPAEMSEPGVCGVPLLPTGVPLQPYAKLPGYRTMRVVGAMETFFVRENVLDTQSGFIEIEAMFAAGDPGQVEVWVETDEWQTHVTQNDVDAIVDALVKRTPAGSVDPERGIIDLEREFFGDPPDVDGNGRIILLILDVRDNYGEDGTSSFVAGYFDQADQLPESQGGSGNLADIIYLDSNPGDPSTANALGAVAHELQHLIHFRYDQNEEPWLNEGLSEFASLLLGYPFRSFATFLSASDRSLTAWDNRIEDYSRVALWTTYLHQRFGLDLISSLVRDSRNGFRSVDGILQSDYSLTFRDIVADWLVANYLNDPDIQEGRFGYGGLSTPQLRAQYRHSSLPVLGVAEDVHKWAADYHEFVGGSDLVINLHGESSPHFAATLIRMSAPVEVEPVMLDEEGQLRLSIEGFGATLGTVVLITALLPETDSGDSTDYYYAAEGRGGFALTEIFYDDGTPDLFVSISDGAATVRFDLPSQSAELVAVSFFLLHGNTTIVEISGENENGPVLYSRAGIIPSPNGWSSVNIPGDLLAPGVPFTVAVRSGQNGLGYDNDSPGEGKSFKEHPDSGRFLPLSDFCCTPSGEPLLGSWLIRATVRSEIDVVIPETFELAQSVPNPFGNPGNSRTFIRYTLAEQGFTTLQIYDILGHLVTTLVAEDKEAGTYPAVWDGKNASGRLVASGVYIYLLKSGTNLSLTRKLTFLK